MSVENKVCIVGSGNWGSVVAKIIGNNVINMSKEKPQTVKFNQNVNMYVYEEIVDNEKLTDIINTRHVNVKYLPGHTIPSNVKAIPDVCEAAKGCNILIFVVPHQFVVRICGQLKGQLTEGTIAISLIKGFEVADGGGIQLISEVIRKNLGIKCAVLMGANIANEVANEEFCESTLGCKDDNMAAILKTLFQTPYFRISRVSEENAVEVCGALKNVVAVGAGFLDGLDYGENTKAAVIRLGLMEMIRFCDEFYPGAKIETFFESCGVADLVTTCFGGRNRRLAEAFARTGKTIESLEEELLNGQKLQGPPTAYEVNHMLKNINMEKEFPLFTSVCEILKGTMPVKSFLISLQNHPEHVSRK